MTDDHGKYGFSTLQNKVWDHCLCIRQIYFWLVKLKAIRAPGKFLNLLIYVIKLKIILVTKF